MIFSGDANNQDIVSHTRWLATGSATSTDYSVNDITRAANIAYHEAVVTIQSADGTWQYDDANNTTLPIATTTLTSGQQDYSLDDSMLEIEMLEVKDSSGTWRKLDPIDIDALRARGESISNYKTTNGAPVEYDKRGRSLFLYPAPSYTQSASLKIHFKRHANIFTPSDTTKEAGFMEAFHQIIPLKAALAYCRNFKPEKVNDLLAQIADVERKMEDFYGRRSKDERKGLRASVENNK